MELKPKPLMNEAASPETLSPHFLLTLGQAGKIRNTWSLQPFPTHLFSSSLFIFAVFSLRQGFSV